MFQNYFQKPIDGKDEKDEKDEKENMDNVNYNGKDYIKIDAEYGYWLLFFWYKKKITVFRSVKKNEILNVSA